MKNLDNIFITESQPLQIYPHRNESHSCCDIPVMTPWTSWGWAASPHTLPHIPCCLAAFLQTDILLSTSASPKIHKLILAQTDTSICVGLREEESAWCLKSSQQAFPLAWAQLGGIPNTSAQSQHLIVFPRHLRCNACFAAVERQKSAPETKHSQLLKPAPFGSACSSQSSCTRTLSKLKQLHHCISLVGSSTTSEQHRDALRTSPNTLGRIFYPTTLAWWVQPSWTCAGWEANQGNSTHWNVIAFTGFGKHFCSVNAADVAVRLALTPLHPHSSLTCCSLCEDQELLLEGSCPTPVRAYHILGCVSNSNYLDIIMLHNSALKDKLPIQPKECSDWNTPFLLKYKGWSLMPCSW